MKMLAVFLIFHLATSSIVARQYGPLELWTSPIEDYRDQAAGLSLAEFNSSITALHVFDDRLWFGYGDSRYNLGTPFVIEFRCFTDPDRTDFERIAVSAENQGATQRTPFDTGEEQIEPFRVCDGVLCQAGVDSNGHDESWTQARGTPKPIAGNFFRLVRAGDGNRQWQKFRSVAGGEHVHDLAQCHGALYAAGSGAANRDEWDEGKVFRYIWRSHDGGQSFQVAWREVCPEAGKTDTRFRQLLAVNETLYAFGYVDPFVDGKPRQPAHVKSDGREFSPLTESENGKIAGQLVVRTWSLQPDLGLVISRDPASENRTNAFLVTSAGFRELDSWPSGRVLDACPETDEKWLLLMGNGEAPESFSVWRFEPDQPESLPAILDLKTLQPTCLAVWKGRLYAGTRDGKIFRSRVDN